MGIGDLSWAAMYSLRSVDDWIGTINSNMGGTSRVGDKGTKTVFGGSGMSIDRAPAGALQGIQIADRTLTTQGTAIDFSQGAIVASTELTHFAIMGDGFFPVMDGGSRHGGGGNIFYTRDGEFHLTEEPASPGSYVLMNSQGMILTIPGADPSAGNNHTPQFNPAKAAQGFDIITGKYSDGTNITDCNATAWNIFRSIVTFPENQGLKFSKYGSTIFAPGTNTAYGPAFTGTATQHASLTQSIPELSLAQKMYSALAKIFQTVNQNTDTVINLIR